MELLVKPEMLTSYIYGPTFGNAETVSFYLLHNVSTLNLCREVSCVAIHYCPNIDLAFSRIRHICRDVKKMLIRKLNQQL